MRIRKGVQTRLALISLICMGAGCNVPNNKPAVTPQPEKLGIVYKQVFKGYQRFVPIRLQDTGGITNDERRNFALDTKTGQLCKTWGFDYGKVTKESLDDGEIGGVQTGLITNCLALYNEYPDDTK